MDKWVCRICVSIAVFLGLFWYPLWLINVNAIGPSTRYYNPVIGTAVPNKDDPDFPIIYLKDPFWVDITVVRDAPAPLQALGTCEFVIRRFMEVVHGPRTGQRHLISVGHLQFRGQDQLIPRTRWPQPNEKAIFLEYAVDEQGNDRRDAPLLADGVDEEKVGFYVVGRYFCNMMDDLIPRYIQGGERNETSRVYATLRRHKP